jgi:hypothetical protein
MRDTQGKSIHMKTRLLLLLVSGLGISGCTPDAGFQAAPEGIALSQFDPSLCKVGTIKKNVRILFMIDDSGSTLQTDPQKRFRVQTIQEFIREYGGNSNLSYSFGYFNGTTAKMYDMVTNRFSEGSAANPVGASSQLSTALLSYESITSASNTPYQAAFNALKNAINADSNPGNDHDYVVVFESDGQPTDVTSMTNLNALSTSLKSAASAKGALLTVSTVYFGDASDSKSISNLSGMAAAGGGRFVNTNVSTNIKINDLITVPGPCL